jgi:hypothetical protein
VQPSCHLKLAAPCQHKTECAGNLAEFLGPVVHTIILKTPAAIDL